MKDKYLEQQLMNHLDGEENDIDDDLDPDIQDETEGMSFDEIAEEVLGRRISKSRRWDIWKSKKIYNAWCINKEITNQQIKLRKI